MTEATTKPDYPGQKAVFINCTHQPSPRLSRTDLIMDVIRKIMKDTGVQITNFRSVDHKIAPGVCPDMTKHGLNQVTKPNMRKALTWVICICSSLLAIGCNPSGLQDSPEAELAAVRSRLAQGNDVRSSIGIREIHDEWMMARRSSERYVFYVGDTGSLKSITVGEDGSPIEEQDNYYSGNEYRWLDAKQSSGEHLVITYNYQSHVMEVHYFGDNDQAKQHMQPLNVPAHMVKAIPIQQKLQIADSVLQEMNMTRFQKYHNGAK